MADRTDKDNRDKILGAIRDMARAQVELHKVLVAENLSSRGGYCPALTNCLNTAKMFSQDAKDKLNFVKLEE